MTPRKPPVQPSAPRPRPSAQVRRSAYGHLLAQAQGVFRGPEPGRPGGPGGGVESGGSGSRGVVARSLRPAPRSGPVEAARPAQPPQWKPRWQRAVTVGHHNRHLVVQDARGRVWAKASGGSAGARGARRRTPLAAERAVHKARQQLRTRAKGRGPRQVHLVYTGSDRWRAPVRRALKLHGRQVAKLDHRVLEPHGGCRRRKPRRVR